MALLDEDPQAEASAPLITDVERVEIVAPSSLPEGYALEVSTTGTNGSIHHSSVIVVSWSVLIPRRTPLFPTSIVLFLACQGLEAEGGVSSVSLDLTLFLLLTFSPLSVECFTRLVFSRRVVLLKGSTSRPICRHRVQVHL